MESKPKAGGARGLATFPKRSRPADGSSHPQEGFDWREDPLFAKELARRTGRSADRLGRDGQRLQQEVGRGVQEVQKGSRRLKEDAERFADDVLP